MSGERPAPRLTLDERGIILHMTDKDGNPIELNLNPDQLLTMLAQGQQVVAKLGTPEGKQLVKGAVRGLLSALLKGDD